VGGEVCVAHGAMQSVFCHVHALADRTRCTLPDGGARVPEVFAAKLEKLVLSPGETSTERVAFIWCSGFIFLIVRGFIGAVDLLKRRSFRDGLDYKVGREREDRFLMVR